MNFWEKIRDIPVKDLVFLDEAGVNFALIRLYARAPKGKRARGSRPHRRGKNGSMISAISLEGIVTSLNLSGSIDGLTFEAFVIRKLIPKLGKGAVVVWDNYSIHKGQEIDKAIEKAGAKSIDLPPYSPDFNPIENCWSKIKSILRSIGARTYRDLESAIAQCPFSNISQRYSGVGLLTPVTVSHHFEKGYRAFKMVYYKSYQQVRNTCIARIGVSNMALDQLEAFLKKMQSEPALKSEVQASSTADEVAQIALKLGFEFSGDELLRMSGKKVGRVTVKKKDLPGEYWGN